MILKNNLILFGIKLKNKYVKRKNEIKKDFPLYMDLMFEKICLKLLRNKKILCDKEFSDIGKWWYKENEIDIVALNDKEILFSECKYKDNVDAEKIYNELKEKSKLIEHNKKEHYAIFAKSFKKKINIKNLKLYDLNDIKNFLQ